MDRAPHLRRFADDWPVVFAAGVALWFAVAALDSSGFSLARDDTPSSSTAASSTASDDKPRNEPVVAGPLRIKVAAFSVRGNKKDPTAADARMTFELRNTVKQNVDFHPSQVTLQRTDISTAPQSPKETIVMGVSPNLTVTAPITFQVDADPSAVYQLVYAGKTLYRGPAF